MDKSTTGKLLRIEVVESDTKKTVVAFPPTQQKKAERLAALGGLELKKIYDK